MNKRRMGRTSVMPISKQYLQGIISKCFIKQCGDHCILPTNPIHKIFNMNINRIEKLLKYSEKFGGLPFIIRNSKLQIAKGKQQLWQCRALIISQGILITFLFSRMVIFGMTLRNGEPKVIFNFNICFAFLICISSPLLLQILSWAKPNEVISLVNSFISFTHSFNGN